MTSRGYTMKPGEITKSEKEGLSLTTFVGVQNVLMFLLSVPMLVLGISLVLNDKECATFMDKPVIAVGALLMLLSFLGLCLAVASKKMSKDTKKLCWIDIDFFQLIIIFCHVILLFCFAIFALEITNSNLAHHVTNSKKQIVTEYRLYEYPKWMRSRLEHASYWATVKQCLVSNNVCGPGILPALNSNLSYAPTSLTPIQGGCCTPPSACNINLLGVTTVQAHAQEPTKRNNVNSTTVADVLLEKEASTATDINSTKSIGNGSVQANISSFDSIEVHQESSHETLHAYTHDCSRWSNLPTQLCFDCDTCKAGVIQSSMDHWRKLGKVYVVLVMIMVVQYALFACYGFRRRSNKDENTRNKDQAIVN